MSEIEIAGRKIGAGHPPFIIAELSANHNGNLETAKRIIEEAKKAGADAVKLQTYRPDTITLNCDREDFQIRGGLWDGRTLYDLYQEAHLPWDWHKELFAHAHSVGITIFSSPFDETAIDLLEELNAPAYKIASFEAIDLSLIRYAARTGKPLIISTGMADRDEIQAAADAARAVGCKQLALLHCVSGYPAPAHDYNLKTIADLQASFDAVIGLSDHTISNTTAIASIALGAAIVEKHFTLDRLGGGPDDSFSLEPQDLKDLCEGAATAWSALGTVDYSRKASEAENAQFRRSLYFAKDIRVGELITRENVKSVRPGFGLAPKYIDDVIGKRVTADVALGTPCSWDLIDCGSAADSCVEPV